MGRPELRLPNQGGRLAPVACVFDSRVDSVRLGGQRWSLREGLQKTHDGSQFGQKFRKGQTFVGARFAPTDST